MSPLMIPANMDMADILGNGFAANQIPVWDGDSFEPSSDYQRKYTRTVVVDQGGKGDYTSVKAACDYVATQNPTSATPWLIIVMPGLYEESAFVVPSYTLVFGEFSPTRTQLPQVNIRFTSTVASGSCITLSAYAGIMWISLIWSGGTMTGDLSLVSIAGTSACLQNCYVTFSCNSTFNAKAIDNNTAANLAVFIDSCTFSFSNSGAGTKGICLSGGLSGSSITVYRSYFIIGGGQAAVITGGTLNYRLSAGSGGTNYLTNSGGAISVNSSYYPSSSGTITHADRTISNDNQATLIAGAATQTPIRGKGTTGQTANIFEGQNVSAAIQWAVGPAGEQKTNQVAAATTLGSVIGKEPVYDVSGTFAGYRPIYDNIT